MPKTIEAIAQKRGRWVEANRENNFEAGLKRLLTDLYPDNAHFIYELLQNAEDARAQEVRFILYDDRIEFEHDGERLFSIEDVDAITSIGFSTKRDDTTSIGKFGVGFKAVFAYTETPEVESGVFHFQIHDMVVPKSDGFSRGKSGDKQTRFVLPFNNPRKPRDRARNEIESLLRTLDVTTLLFLTQIRKIEYLLPDSSLGYIERIELGEHRFEIRVQQPDEIASSSAWFLKFDKDVEVEDEEAELGDQKIKVCRIAVAFGLSPVEVGSKDKKGGRDAAITWELVPMEPGRVCIYFPADKETSNLRVHLHAPFASTVARDSVRDCAGNNVLRDHLAELLAESMPVLRDQGLLTVRALALLPNDRDNLPQFYQPLMTRLVQQFKDADLLPMKRGGHAAASGVYRGQRAISDLIDDDDLVILLGDDYFPPIWIANPPQRNQREDHFISMLDIEQWDIAELVGALGAMDKDSRAKWMGSKEDEWHKDFYEILMDYLSSAPKYPYSAAEERKAALRRIAIVRTSNGTYRSGSECYFPTDQVEHDEQFPRVCKQVFHSGNEVIKKVRDFLEVIGVREVDEQVEIEALLRARYADKSVRPTFEDHLGHLMRFMKFVKENPSKHSIFRKAHLFVTDSEVDVRWTTPASVYIDGPFLETGLRAYFEETESTCGICPLSIVYERSNSQLKGIGEFAKLLGAVTILPIETIKVSYEHPEWRYLSSRGGERFTGSGMNLDYRIPGLAVFLASPDVKKSRLLWRTMTESCGENGREYLQAWFGRNASNIALAKSTLVHDLATLEWVPQKQDEKLDFVQPRDAVAERLPDGFEFQTGWWWLKELEFGKNVDEQREAGRRAQEQHTTEYKRKEEVAKDLGFESPEEAEEMARLKREDPEGFRRWQESRQPKPSFPEPASVDPERRKSKAAQRAIAAPRKQYEKKERSVRTSRAQGKTEVEVYLRNLYTNDEGQLICQICEDEMPFRKKDGKHYFEKVEAFDLPREHEANYLALCPVCAAKYDEFVFHDPNEARKTLRRAFKDLGAHLKLPVQLGEQSATIRFVESHAIDLRASISTD